MATISPGYIGVFPITVDETGTITSVSTTDIGYWSDTMTITPGNGVAVVIGFDQSKPIGEEFAINCTVTAGNTPIETQTFLPTGNTTNDLGTLLVNRVLNTNWWLMSNLLTINHDSLTYYVNAHSWTSGSSGQLGGDFSALVHVIACPTTATSNTMFRVFWEQNAALTAVSDPWLGTSGLTEIGEWVTKPIPQLNPNYLGIFPITVDATGKVITVDTHNVGYYQDTMTFSPGTGIAVVKGFDQALPIGIEFAIHDTNSSLYRTIETCQFVPTGTVTDNLGETVINAMLNTDWYDVGMAQSMIGSDDSVAYDVGMRTWADGTATTLGADYSAVVELIACPTDATFDVTVRVFWEQTELLSGIVNPWQGISGLTEVEVWTTSAPVVTLTFISTTRISHIEGHTQCVAKFIADRDILQWEARANGAGPGTGFLVGQGTDPVTANTEVQFEIDDTELPEADGGYDIYVYVQDTATGQWA